MLLLRIIFLKEAIQLLPLKYISRDLSLDLIKKCVSALNHVLKEIGQAAHISVDVLFRIAYLSKSFSIAYFT